jgi:hypothetical protein
VWELIKSLAILLKNPYTFAITVWRHGYKHICQLLYFIITLGMKTNKLIAGFTAVALVMASVANIGIYSSAYADSAENMAAYENFYDIGATSMNSYSAFNFEGTTTREAAARFLVKIAESLGADLSSDQVCDYSDLSSADQSLVEFINAGCEQGIFKAQAEFNPKATFTRAMGELTIARIVYGMDEVAAYAEDNNLSEYAAARELLMADEIVKVEIPADSAMRRGHLALMALRLADMDVIVDPVDPIDTGAVVKAGDLNVALNASSPSNGSSIPYNGVVSFGKVDLAAGSKDVTVNTIKMKREGLGQYGDFSRIYFEKDGARVSSRSTVNSDNEAVVTFSPALVVKAGSTTTLDLIAEMAASVSALGGEHKFTSTLVDSTAANTNGSFSTPLLRTSNYSVATVAVSAAGAANTYNIDADRLQVMGEFRVANTSTRDLNFKSVMLYNNGTANLEFLKDVAIYRNDVLVSNSAVINGRYVTFTTSSADLIKQGTTALYTVKAKIVDADRAGDNYIFQLRKSEEVNVQEKDTGFRTVVTGAPATMATQTVNGADLKFVDSTTTSSLTKVPGSKEVEFFKGTMTAKQAVNVEDLKVGFASSGALNTYVTRFYFVVGNQTFSAEAPATNSGTLTFDGVVSINAGQTLNARIYADIKDTAPAGYIDFKGTTLNKINLSAFVGTNEYVSNSQVISSSIGAIYGAKVTINAANLKFENSTTSTKTVVRGERLVTIATPVISTTTDVNVKVNSFGATISGSVLNNFAGGTVYVYDANGAIIANDTIRAGSTTLNFNNLNLTVAKGTDVRLTMKLDEVSRTTVSGDVIRFTLNNINATDTVTSNAVIVAPVTAVTLNVVPAATVNVSSNPANTPKLVQAGSNTKIGSVKVSATNSTAVLKTLSVLLSGGLTTDKLSNITLKDGTTAITSTVTKTTTTKVDFSDITFEVPAAGFKTIDVYADVANVSSIADLSGSSSLTTYLNAAGFETVAGDAFAATTTGYAISAAMEVVKYKPTIAFKRVQKGSDYATYVFSVTPSAGEIRLTDLKVSLGNNLATGANGAVELSTAINGGTVYGTVAAYASTINYTGMNISITNETELYVTVKGVTWSTSANNTPYISIGVSDFNYSDVLSDGNVSHANVLSKFYSDVAGAADLIKNVQ